MNKIISSSGQVHEVFVLCHSREGGNPDYNFNIKAEKTFKPLMGFVVHEDGKIESMVEY